MLSMESKIFMGKKGLDNEPLCHKHVFDKAGRHYWFAENLLKTVMSLPYFAFSTGITVVI